MNSNAFQKSENDKLKVAIKEEQLNVAPETRATLNVGIFNNNPYEDDVDLIVKGVPPEWVNLPTSVVHLAPGEAKLVTFSVRPASASDQRVAQYNLEVRAVSQRNPEHFAVGHSALTVAAYQSKGRIGVMLGSVHFSVSPGSITDIPILLQNRGDEADTFRLNVRGLPEGWILTNSTLTNLLPNESLEIQLTLRVPRSPQAAAGRNPFTIQFTSELFPTQSTDVDCILTIGSFLQFSTSLEPGTLQAGQLGQIIIDNEGNTADSYSLSFQSPENELIFEKVVQVAQPGPQPGTQQLQTALVEIPPGERLQVRAGERGTYSFLTRLRSRPIVGNEQTYSFTANVRSTSNTAADLAGQVSEKAWIPYWVVGAGIAGLMLLCLLFLIPLFSRNIPTSASATQTAVFNQTQTALAAQGDADADGLTSDREVALGTDPLKPDTDDDKLLDGDEVNTHLTNPLAADTDGDGLQDGDEVLTYQTDPRNPDMDADGRSDGLEIAGGTDPRNPDSDGDGVKDGDEVKLGTDPRNPDSDGDGLKDGQENETCPRPRVPDSDNDGIVDGKDLNPCDASNPALTATAAALTAGAPTVTPTLTLTATATLTPSVTPISPTAIPPLPSLQGIMVFSSDRDGNSEIYALNLANLAAARLTSNAAQDVQPALAPDSVQVAYVTNQDGNNEIYLTGVNGGGASNLTKNAADDQQPTWSPDGNWIAFTTSRDGNQEIYIMRRDGSEVRNLTSNAANDFAPTWFSVGSLLGTQDWIAFTSTRDGNQEIYKVRPDGTGLTNLTQNPANDHSPAGFTGGAILTFVSDRNGNSEIYAMTDTGGTQIDITNSPAQDIDPAFNPGGNWIAFSTDRDGNQEIYIVGTNGGPVYNLTRNPSQDRYPDW
jgi:Tol biopolymer transport system component